MNGAIGTAILLWSVVGGFVGAIAAVLLGFSGRAFVFFIVLGVGIVLLGSVWVIVGRERRKPAERTLVIPMVPREVSPPNALKEGPVLSAEEARQWLDDFLVKQQDDSRKQPPPLAGSRRRR